MNQKAQDHPSSTICSGTKSKITGNLQRYQLYIVFWVFFVSVLSVKRIKAVRAIFEALYFLVDTIYHQEPKKLK